LSVQIEGSARVRLEDGTLLRISYDAHNGYPFAPVGRLLIEQHLVAREEISIPRIREWMHDNPEGAKMIRRQNRQVVFFRIVGLNDDTEAVGAQGIPLTAGRSIAVDKALHAYGTPFFIESDLPPTGAGSQQPFRRLMIAQDTGAAILGPARADLYFGAGDEAGQIAGRIQQSGRFAILVPRELGSSVMSASVPLPPAKPSPSLASYAFRAVVRPAKFEHQQIATRKIRPGALRPVDSSPAKSEPLQVAAHTPPPAKRESLQVAAHTPPPAKREPLQVAAHTPPPAKRESLQVAAHTPPPARPRPSQVTAGQVARPRAVRAEVSEVGARALRPGTSKPGVSQVAAGARETVANPVAQQTRRHSVRFDRPRPTSMLAVGGAGDRQR
jgi:membrane-bound lytic murein transglycosylase A